MTPLATCHLCGITSDYVSSCSKDVLPHCPDCHGNEKKMKLYWFYKLIVPISLMVWRRIVARVTYMLTTKELVQINATIIGGILIFMTLALTSFSDKESSLYRFIITLVTSSVLFPYALSAITAIDEKSEKSIGFLKIGLVYSVVVGLIFVILSYLRDILGIVRWKIWYIGTVGFDNDEL